MPPVVAPTTQVGDSEDATVVMSHRPTAPAVPAPAFGEPSLTSATDALRRGRLQAASLALMVIFTISLVWELAHDARTVIWPLDVAVILALGATLALLAGSRPISTTGLRAIELAIFGMSAGVLGVDQYHAGVVWGARGDDGALATLIKNSVASTLMLIFAYAMLIPNPVKVAARVIAGLALVPFLTQMVLFVTHPEIARQLQVAREASFERVGENVVIVAIAAGLATYGTHILGSLRREAHEARQLNQYQLGRLIGRGGMGDVYLAEHRLLKRPCAIKLVRPDAAGDPSAQARFEREVRTTARLSHPNTVEIYDYGHADDGTFYYVMEYLTGMSLEDLVLHHGPLPPGRVIYLLSQACDALSEAHTAGLIHRDLKPANIFSARRGGMFDFVKLLDFGLVKELTMAPGDPLLSREGSVRGTPQFMAPEQATGTKLDHRCDLYAIGGVAYFLLTGRPPFDGETSLGVMIAHVRDPLVPPSRYRPDTPADLEAVVLKCMAKNRDHRYADATELRRALTSCESASEWNADRAAEWWRGIEPSS
jgi:hypothetical protein